MTQGSRSAPPRPRPGEHPEDRKEKKDERLLERKFKCRDLIEHSGGRGSLGKIGQLTALIVSSGCFIYMACTDTMTEFYFMGYMIAWSGANVANKLADLRNGSRGRERRDRHRDHDDYDGDPR